jgi:benzoyl-CoA reductase subunit A
VKYVVGIDLGSTTTKAVVLGEAGQVLGRGITNSRSNYTVACAVALGEALTNARFGLIASELERRGAASAARTAALIELERLFRKRQYQDQLEVLGAVIHGQLGRDAEGATSPLVRSLDLILERMEAETAELYAAGANRKSDFFRDLAGSRYVAHAEATSRSQATSFDRLVGLFDRAILEVENRPAAADSFRTTIAAAVAEMPGASAELRSAVERAAGEELTLAHSIGTGYGRQTLPFPREQIRSEILCHGLGAHAMFPGTRTVLDIGGQDTKAIQVDAAGIVTSFQMNDRCAAGCGRYLGYIADEMNLGLHELGPLACESSRPVRINSTCTVFAGAELRERLSLGERREDILAGLHRAIILRAMSLLARSGGIADEFTFTGGVAKNPAAVGALEGLVRENYGQLTMNISPDSIYTGALGAALFAHREMERAPGPENRA